MVRPVYAVLGAVVLVLGWLALVAYQARWEPAAAVESLADSAERCRLVGIAAKGYLLAADLRRQELERLGRRSGDETSRRLIAQIVTLRTKAARVLLDSGYREAAEAVALQVARADYGDLQARALLLETRLGSPAGSTARRELMLMLLKGEHPQVLYVLGKALAAGPHAKEAAGYLQRALELDPSHFPTYVALCELALAENDRGSALHWLERAATVANGRAQRELLVRLRGIADPRYQPLPVLAGLWWCEHWVGVATALGYLVFVFSPLWLAPLFGRR